MSKVFSLFFISSLLLPHGWLPHKVNLLRCTVSTQYGYYSIAGRLAQAKCSKSSIERRDVAIHGGACYNEQIVNEKIGILYEVLEKVGNDL